MRWKGLPAYQNKFSTFNSRLTVILDQPHCDRDRQNINNYNCDQMRILWNNIHLTNYNTIGLIKGKFLMDGALVYRINYRQEVSDTKSHK